jgi:hypothetical protein
MDVVTVDFVGIGTSMLMGMNMASNGGPTFVVSSCIVLAMWTVGVVGCRRYRYVADAVCSVS